MLGRIAGSHVNLATGFYRIMQVPIIHIDQSRFSLVMAITIGAFDDIFADLYHRDDRAGATIFTGGAGNR